jgi:hypothetical protein
MIVLLVIATKSKTPLFDKLDWTGATKFQLFEKCIE